MEHGCEKQVYEGIAYYTLPWSDLQPISKHRIIASVPSLPGIWELYWLENSRKPRLLKLGRAWYGGLRSELRIETDSTDSRNQSLQQYLESGDCYYRYVVCDSSDDLEDVFITLAGFRNVPQPTPSKPKRYREILLKESEEMIIHRTRTPHQKQSAPESYGNRVPNMFDVMREIALMEKEKQDNGQKDS